MPEGISIGRMRVPAIIKQFLASTSAAIARGILGASPLPQTAVGAGQVVSVQSADGGAVSLPGTAGQSYWYFNVHALNNSTLVFSKATAAIAQSGIAVGGTQIVAGTAGYYMALDCMRIA